MRALTFIVLVSAASTAAQAQTTYAAVQPLLAKNNCLACHGVDTKIVGPAYRDIAAKYKGKADAPEYLAKKIKGGSAGVWGPVAMPPNAAVPDAEIKTIVDWLVAGAPGK